MQPGMVLGQAEVGDLQVGRPHPAGVMGPGGQLLGVLDQGGDPAGADEAGQLGRPRGRQLGPGFGHDRPPRRSPARSASGYRPRSTRSSSPASLSMAATLGR